MEPQSNEMEFQNYTKFANIKNKMSNINVGVGSAAHADGNVYYVSIEVASREAYAKGKKITIFPIVSAVFSYDNSCKICSEFFNYVCKSFGGQNTQNIVYNNPEIFIDIEKHCNPKIAIDGAINELKRKLNIS